MDRIKEGCRKRKAETQTHLNIKIIDRIKWYVRQRARKKGILLFGTENKCEADKQVLLAICFPLISCFAYFSTLKIEATCSSETLAGFQRTTRRYVPEDRTLHIAPKGMNRKGWPTISSFVTHIVASTNSTERNKEYSKRKRVDEEEGRKRTE
jgi:hypothetical protein